MSEPEKKPKKKDSSALVITHKCADCGAPTPDHRCRKCLAAWRAKHHVVVYNTDE